jgi:hypothetical protein
MKLVTRDKDEFIVFRNFEHNWDDSNEVLMSNQGNCWMPLSDYNEELQHEEFVNDDIVEVYRPIHIYSVANFFGADNAVYDWELIWEREPKKEIKEESTTVNYTINISVPNDMNKNKISELIANEIEKAKYNY